jgi:glycosyltransferase involved in cell wall biosynthesis
MNDHTKKSDDQIWLSVVIIGRNEGKNLPGLFASLPSSAQVEWIYVDSHSEDNSAAIALKHGAAVFILDRESVYAPGTGRYVGTREARGRWILYLDGDMVLRQEFVDFIRRLEAEDKGGAEDLPPGIVAFAGRTINRLTDPDGEVVEERDYVTLPKRDMGSPGTWGKRAGYHGGAVLYLKEAVIAAGNWNPAVYQLEEIDLYSRVRAAKGYLRAIDLPMADHYTPYLGIADRLKLNFLPQWRGKKLYGAGQVVSARLAEGGIISFLSCYPYPFIVLVGLVFAPLLYFAWPPLAILVNLAIFFWFAVTKKWYYYLVYLGNLLQILRGLGRYQRFEPIYRRFNN